MHDRPKPFVLLSDAPPPEAGKPELTDEHLMLAFTRGSEEAFETVFARYRQPLFGFFRRRVADAAQAEELTQDTFLAVLRASSRYEPSALFRTYLYAIGFRILNASRRKAAFRSIFHAAQPTGIEAASPSTTLGDLVVREALDKLDPQDREILMLREFEQLPYAEIAALLGLPLNTIRSRLFRARAALHNLLAAPAAMSPKERV